MTTSTHVCLIHITDECMWTYPHNKCAAKQLITTKSGRREQEPNNASDGWRVFLLLIGFQDWYLGDFEIILKLCAKYINSSYHLKQTLRYCFKNLIAADK